MLHAAKGQSSAEFLTIFAAVFIVALAATALISQSTSYSAQSRYLSSRIYWQNSAPLAVTDAKAVQDGVVLLVRNTGKERLLISSVTVSGLPGEPQTTEFESPIAIEPGLSKKLQLHSRTLSGGDFVSAKLSFEYSISPSAPPASFSGQESLLLRAPAACNARGEICSQDSSCCEGAFCRYGECGGCGWNAEPCQEKSDCCGSLVCNDGLCSQPADIIPTLSPLQPPSPSSPIILRATNIGAGPSGPATIRVTWRSHDCNSPECEQTSPAPVPPLVGGQYYDFQTVFACKDASYLRLSISSDAISFEANTLNNVQELPIPCQLACLTALKACETTGKEACCPGLSCIRGSCSRCIPAGSACASDSDCCKGLCDPLTKTCNTCLSAGNLCSDGEECCSGSCNPAPLPAICTGSPDLVSHAEGGAFAHPVPIGEPFTISVSALNAGSAASPPSTLLIGFGINPPIELLVPGLAPAASYSHEAAFSCPEQGIFGLQLAADPNSEVEESDEQNNNWQGAIECLPPLPDLIARTDGGPLMEQHELNSTFFANITTHNIGSVMSPETSTLVTFDGAVNSYINIPELPAGQSHVREIPLRCMQEGILSLELSADSALEADEIDETNNHAPYPVACGNVTMPLMLAVQSPGHNISMREDHPRLFITQETIPIIRTKLGLGTPILSDDFRILKSQYELETNGISTPMCNMSSQNQNEWTAVMLNTTNMSQRSCGNGRFPVANSWGILLRVGTFLYWTTGNETYLNRSKFMFNRLTELFSTYNVTWNYWADDPNTPLSGADDLEWFYTSYSMDGGIAYDWLYNNLSSGERTNFTTAFARFVTYYHHRDFAAATPAYVMSHSFEIQHGYGLGLLSLLYDPDLTAANATLAEIALNQSDIWYAREQEFYRVYNYTGSDNGGWNWGTSYSFGGIQEQAMMAAALTTATGTNWLYSQPWLKDRVLNHFAYLTKPSTFHANWGDSGDYIANPPQGTIATSIPVAPYVISYYSPSPYNEYANGYIASPTNQISFEKTYRWYNRLWEIAWFDEAADRRDFSTLPLDWFSRNAGTMVSRSSWGNDSTWLTYSNNPRQLSSHLHRDANSFSLYYRGDLALDTGAYYHGSAHELNYFKRTIAHNTITVFNPDEVVWPNGENGVDLWNDSGIIRNISNDGGQVAFPRMFTYDDLTNQQEHVSGTIPRYGANENYTYIVGDATNSYNRSKLNNFTRELVFLKPGTIVIFDRVNATDPNFQKRFLLHFQNEPSVSGAITGTEVPGRIVTYDGDVVNATEGNGSLTSITLLPASHNITKVGGAGYEYWVDGRNYPPPSPPAGAWEKRGNWRVEVSPTVPRNFDNFLHILLVSDSNATPASDYSLLTFNGDSDGSLAGARINNATAVFSSRGSPATYLNFTLDYQGAMRFLFANLQPSTTYYVEIRNESSGISDFLSIPSSDQGIISFFSLLGSPTTISATTTSGCTEDWVCGGWGECIGGAQSRACTDQNSCGTTYDRPPLSQFCASCTDGLQNSDETGIDCGGSFCPACPTCSDGIQNQGEEGVDCGGPCAACAQQPGGGGGGSGGAGGAGGAPIVTCFPNWLCTDWSPCSGGGTQERYCLDTASCHTDSGMPALQSNCSPINSIENIINDYTGSLAGNETNKTVGFLERVADTVGQGLGISQSNITAIPPGEKKPSSAADAISVGGLIAAIAAGALLLTLLLLRLRPHPSLPASPSAAEGLQSQYAKLESYIATSLAEGHTQEEIAHALLDAGWAQEDISRAFASVQGKGPLPQTPS